jgi:hypothetical protein
MHVAILSCKARPFSMLGWCAVLVLAFAGCGGPRLYPVEGTVEFADGSPARALAGASVEFDPVEGKTSARGIVQTDGSFRMGTNIPGDGVAPGTYRVGIQPPLPALDRPSPRVIDRRFENPVTSGLQVTVPLDKNQPKVVLKVQGPTKAR